MKGVGLMLVMFATCVKLNAQVNLVPNPSFDAYSSCPTGSSQIYLAVPWTDANGNSSDFYHACSSALSVPCYNLNYWQNSHSGSGMAAIWLYQVNGNYREYLQVQLYDTLQTGKCYLVKFYVVPAHGCRYAVNSVAAFISSFQPTQSSNNLVMSSYVPQIVSPGIITDTLNWTLVSGYYIANGGENFITIGSFLTDSGTGTQYIGGPYNGSYYFVDDISVAAIDSSIVTGNDTTICSGDSVILGASPIPSAIYSWSPTAGLNDPSLSNPIAGPSTTTTYTLTQTQCNVVSTATVNIAVRNDCAPPEEFFIPTVIKTSDLLTISGLEPNSKLEIYDGAGRLVYENSDYQNDFGGFRLSAGIYFVRFTKPSGELVKQKLCVVR